MSANRIKEYKNRQFPEKTWKTSLSNKATNVPLLNHPSIVAVDDETYILPDVNSFDADKSRAGSMGNYHAEAQEDLNLRFAYSQDMLKIPHYFIQELFLKLGAKTNSQYLVTPGLNGHITIEGDDEHDMQVRTVLEDFYVTAFRDREVTPNALILKGAVQSIFNLEMVDRDKLEIILKKRTDEELKAKEVVKKKLVEERTPRDIEIINKPFLIQTYMEKFGKGPYPIFRFEGLRVANDLLHDTLNQKTLAHLFSPKYSKHIDVNDRSIVDAFEAIPKSELPTPNFAQRNQFAFIGSGTGAKAGLLTAGLVFGLGAIAVTVWPLVIAAVAFVAVVGFAAWVGSKFDKRKAKVAASPLEQPLLPNQLESAATTTESKYDGPPSAPLAIARRLSPTGSRAGSTDAPPGSATGSALSQLGVLSTSFASGRNSPDKELDSTHKPEVKPSTPRK